MSEFNETINTNTNTNTNTNNINIDVIALVQAFNTKVNQTYQSHCGESEKSKLLDPDSEPYLNIVFRLFDNGRVLVNLGGNAYNPYHSSVGANFIKNACRLPFKFAITNVNKETYVILTQEEIREFRKEMESIIKIALDSGYLKPFDKEKEVQALNQRVIHASKAHLDENGKCTLIIPDMSPNDNTIYSLYSDGTITYQKGGSAYGSRYVFESEYKFNNFRLCNFNFGDKIASDGSTYVLLTNEECIKFRNQMFDILKICEQS